MPLADLRPTLTAAFAAAPYPGAEALVSGDTSYDPEIREVARAFAGKHWRELSPRFIREQRDVLPLLTPAAFRFFLPAYLLACLEAEQDLDTAPLAVVLSLAPPAHASATSAFVERTALFTPAEARVIYEALSLLRQREVAPERVLEQALAYWRLRAL